ncbi:MAG TPA: WYL domain-containing protein, partial [Roseiflexaceae bacterium]|nr:WYL domain-containing protein [Roseiflexaceae bacterium]
LMLTDDEALAITLSLIAARRQGSVADAMTIEGALAKIERVLPDGLRARLQALQSVVEFTPTSAGAQPQAEALMAISTATQQLRRVRLHYESRGEQTLREFDPYGLVSHEDRWYTVGWCHLRKGLRVFRLDRVRQVAVGEATFDRPAEFDSLRYVLDSLATAPWGWEVEVLLETTLEDALRRIPAGTAVVEPTPAGVLVRSNVDRLDWMASRLLSLDCPFVIRRPPELRDALRRLARYAATLAERGEHYS